MFLSLALLAISQLPGPSLNPELSWKTISTEEFFLHYEEPLESVAKTFAVEAQDIYHEMTKRLRWKPAEPFHIVLSDSRDEPNGLSTPLPYNTIYLYGSPPTGESTLDDYDDWLRTLFIHEFTHTLHLDMAKGLNRTLRFFMGRLIVPNAPQQQWAHEGLAIFYETLLTKRGRGRSSAVREALRTAALENKWTPIDRATYWNDQPPYGHAAYWFGIGFFQFLQKRFGEEKIIDWMHRTASYPVLGFQNFKSARIFEKSFHRLWEEWRVEQMDYWNSFAQKFPSRLNLRFLSGNSLDDSAALLGSPYWDDSRQTLWTPLLENSTRRLVGWTWTKDRWTKSETVDGFAPESFVLWKDWIIYSALSSKDGYEQSYDLFARHRNTGEKQRLTNGLRVRDASLGPSGLTFIQTRHFRSRLLSWSYPDLLATIESKTPLESDKTLEVVFEAPGLSALSSPRWSPDRKTLVFSMNKARGHRDLYLLRDGQLAQMTSDDSLEYSPQWIDNHRILYSVDLPHRDSTERIFQVVGHEIKTGERKFYTDVLTGVRWPTATSKGWAAGLVSHKKMSPVFSSWSSHSLAPKAPVPKMNFTAARTEETTEAAGVSGDYRFGSALLPRYLLPIVFVTESDSLVALTTGSRDPLGIHQWSALAFQLLGPNQPGGSLSYVYGGVAKWFVVASAGTSLTNYGTVIRLTDEGQPFWPQNYYERSWEGSLSVARQFYPLSLSARVGAFVEKRESVFSLPPNAIQNVIDPPHVRAVPETGVMWGIRFRLLWQPQTHADSHFYDLSSPAQSLRLNAEYTPKGAGSDFHTLTTSLQGRTSWNLTTRQALAARGVVGVQWLDVLYQRSFLMGGSFGDSPFSNINRRNYALRGMPTSHLRGEALLLSSVEWALTLLRQGPSLGTAPLWIKNLKLAPFVEGGQTFQFQKTQSLIDVSRRDGDVQQFKWSRFSLSSGAELRSESGLFYGPPIELRFGYGRVLFRQGQKPSARMDEFYFQVGSSF
jgi:hypothetical protein